MLIKKVICLLFLCQGANAALPQFTDREKIGFESYKRSRNEFNKQKLRASRLQQEEQNSVVMLPKMDAEDTYSISGFSAGAAMAVQYHVSYSSVVSGVGILSGVPYYCAQGTYDLVDSACLGNTTAGPPFNLTHSIQQTNSLAKEGKIDSTENLKNAALWLFSGQRDTVINPSEAVNIENYYSYYGVLNLKRVNNTGAGHGFITDDYSALSICTGQDALCSESCWKYINDCGYNAAEEILTSIYGPLNPPSEMVNSSLIEFDQTPYSALGLGSSGYAYIPQVCYSKSCNIHMFLHGCNQYVEYEDEGIEFGMGLIRNAGFNEFAETNNLIILYPQATSDNISSGYGYTGGCWDYWGYTGSEYVTQQAAQIASFNLMIQQLQSSQTSSKPHVTNLYPLFSLLAIPVFGAAWYFAKK